MAPRVPLHVRAKRDVFRGNMNNDKNNQTTNDFLANVLKHDAFRKGVAAAAAGALFAVASVAIFGPSDNS